jgi:hypothetical protein
MASLWLVIIPVHSGSSFRQQLVLTSVSKSILCS